MCDFAYIEPLPVTFLSKHRVKEIEKMAKKPSQTVDKLDENRVCLQSFFGWRWNGAVDFRSRSFAFRGAGGEPPRRRWRLRGLTCPSDPAGVYAPSTPINRIPQLSVELTISLF